MLTLLRTPAFLVYTVMLLSTCLALTACGSSKSSKSSSSAETSSQTTSTSATSAATTAAATRPASQASIPAASSPTEVVATVAGKPIELAAVRHQMALENRPSHEVPDAPAFTGCVSHLHGSKPGSSETQLKQECSERYLALLEASLSKLIHAQWISAEAKGLGLGPHKAELAREVKENLAQGETIKRMGLSISDVKSELLLGQLSNRLYERVKAHTPRVTPALVAQYYATHKKLYAVPEQRDLYIIRTLSEDAAQQVLREVRSGRSFAQVVKKIALPQPIKTKEALLLGLTPKFFSEPVLAEAIFRAKPRVLSGPVHIELGYYVYEVLKVHPARQQSLAEVRKEIAAELPARLHEEVLLKAVADFKKKWLAQTSCRAHYVVENCREFKLSAAEAKASGERNLQDDFTF